MGEPGIEIALTLQREGFHLDVQAQLPGSGVSVVFGPSGSGKSTLLRALAGLEPGVHGRLRVRGDCWQDTAHLLPAHRRRVGIVFQQPALLPHLSVRANLRYGARRAGSSAHVLEAWAARLGIEALLMRAPETLSGGERQRVALARALVTEPDWLLLDEPLSALDEPRRAEILPLLETIRDASHIPILLVTHSLAEASRLADHLVLLDAGRVVASGPALEMFRRTDLPLALREDAGTVIEAEVRACDAHGLLDLASGAGLLHAHGAPREPGSRVRLRVQARDVGIALSAQRDTSLLNVLPATVEALAGLPGGQVQVSLRVGDERLLARIAHRSATALALAPGQAVWAQVKAVAILA